jgi:hypothetical protein
MYISSKLAKTMALRGLATIKETANKLGYDDSVISRWAREGKLLVVRNNRQIFVQKASVVTFLESKDPQIVKVLGLKAWAASTEPEAGASVATPREQTGKEARDYKRVVRKKPSDAGTRIARA